MRYLEQMKLKELKDLKKFVSQFESMEELLYELDSTISTKQKDQEKSLNDRFDMAMFKKLNMFEPEELKVLVENNINNLQELIDCDLNSLIGMRPSMKRKFLWIRQFYDMSALDNGGHVYKKGK